MGFTETCTRVSFPGGPAAAIRGAGRRHRERVEPFDTSGALGTGLDCCPGSRAAGLRLPGFECKRAWLIRVRLSDSGPDVTRPGAGRQSPVPALAEEPMTGGAGDDVAWGRGTAWAPKAAPHHPLSGPRRSFLQGRAGSRGSLCGTLFLARMAGKKPRRRPAGRAAKQQPDAALEAACRLSRQWSLRGGGESLVGGRNHLAQVAASETWSGAGSLREFTSCYLQ